MDADRRLRGVVTRNGLRKWLEDPHPVGKTLSELARDPVVAYPDEPLRVVVYRMAETGLTCFPVVERGAERRLAGVVGLQDLLSARTRNLSEERDRERILRVRLPVPPKSAPGRIQERLIDARNEKRLGPTRTSRREQGTGARECATLYHREKEMKYPMLLLLPVMAFAATADVRVLRVPDGGIQPSVLVEPNGAWDILYYGGDPKNGDLFLVRSADHGKTFSPPLRVNSQAGSALALGTIRGGQMALGANGRLHVAWNGSGIARPLGPMNPEAGSPGESDALHAAE